MNTMPSKDVEPIIPPVAIEPVRKKGVRGFAAGFWEGMSAPWRGFQYMWRNPSLWTFGWAPVVMNLVITTMTLVGMGYGVWKLVGWIHGNAYFASGWWGRTQEVVLVLGVVVAGLGATLALYFLLASALCGYFYGLLAQEVEKQLGMHPKDMKELPLRYQVVDAVKDFSIIGVTTVLCLGMGCVPVVGSVVGGAISLYVDCFVFGYDYLDLPMELRAMRRKEKRAFAKRHRAQTLGLGLVVFGFNFVPVLGSVMLTTAAVGAVLMHRRLVAEEARSQEPEARILGA